MTTPKTMIGPGGAAVRGAFAAAISLGFAISAAKAQAPSMAPADPARPATPVAAELAPDVQVVRLVAPRGTQIEILGPTTEFTLAAADPSSGVMMVGLKVGIAYRLKLSHMPTVAEGSELFPVVELVGHLHRPPGIDPYKYPIQIGFDEEDLTDAAARGRMVTKVVYLEAPEQAVPINFPKDITPTLTLSPVENPLKVAPALGRVMAILRVGGRARRRRN